MRTYLVSLVFLTAMIVPYTPAIGAECNLISQDGNQRPIKVLYFHPANHEMSFWHLQSKLTQAAALSLGIELEMVEITSDYRNRFAFVDLVKQRLNSANKPDYVVGIFYANGEENLLKTVEEAQIPYFSLNTSLSEQVIYAIGKPRTTFKYWIGHIAPNDKTAGHDLALALSRLSNQKPKSMLAINGSTQSAVGHSRKEGYLRASEQGEFKVMPVFHTDWSSQDSYRVTTSVLKRMPAIDILWTAGPDIASGAIQAIDASNTKARENIVIGTFDWSPDVAELIKQGELDVSFGGHFVEGIQAMVMLLDYANGIDFAEDTDTLMETKLKPLNKDNVDNFSQFIANKTWEDFDFKTLSKCYTPSLQRYDFSVERLLR